MALYSDFLEVTINGADRTSYIIDYSRYDNLCELGSQFTITFASEIPAITTYDSIVITEKFDGDDTVVIRGYIISTDESHEGRIIANGNDKAILLFEYFVDNQIESNGESVDFWIQYFADLVGLDVEFQAFAGPGSIVPDGSLLGMRSPGDSILEIERIAAYYTKYDSQIDKLVTYRLGTSEPQITISSPIMEGTRTLGTEKTRNVVKVYGGWRFDPDDLSTEQIFAQASTEIPELLVDKTVTVVNSYLKRQTYAWIVANRLLNTVKSLDDMQFYMLPGFYSNIQVGDVAHVNLGSSYYFNYEADRVITTIEASLDADGAKTVFGIGEKCPRISIQLPIPPLYATGQVDGVAVSWDGGDNFVPSNTGLLTTGGEHGKSIAANSYSQQMVVTAGDIYRRYSSAGTWLPLPTALPDPINESLDPIPVTTSGVVVTKVVDEPTHRNAFHLLATGQVGPAGISGFYRAWVYSTLDFGQSWDSTQLYVPSSGLVVISGQGGIPGRNYDVLAHDMTAGVGNKVFAEVTATGTLSTRYIPEEDEDEEDDPIEIYWAGTFWTGAYFMGLWDGGSGALYDFRTYGVLDYNRGGGGIFSIPADRNVLYIVYVLRKIDPGNEVEYRVTVLRTTNGLPSEAVVVLDNEFWFSGTYTGTSNGKWVDSSASCSFDEASTLTEFNAVCMAQEWSGSHTLRAFFIRANTVTGAVTFRKTSSSVSGLTDGPGEGITFPYDGIGMRGGSGGPSTNTYGTNYAYSIGTSSRNFVPDDWLALNKFVRWRANMTTQTLSVIGSASELLNADIGAPLDAGPLTANGTTSYWRHEWRDRFPLPDTDPVEYRGAILFKIRANGATVYELPNLESFRFNNILQQYGTSAVPFSLGTAGALGFQPRWRFYFGQTYYWRRQIVHYANGGRAFHSHYKQNRFYTEKKIVGPMSNKVWMSDAGFELVYLSNNIKTLNIHWDPGEEVTNVPMDDFAFKTFVGD